MNVIPKIEVAEDVYDIVVVGGGPAALTAGIYASRARMKTLLIESLSIMGQATMTDVIENYPGIEKTGGYGLIEKFKKQASAFGAESRFATVSKIDRVGLGDNLSGWEITDDTGSVRALSVIVATGAKASKLGVPGEEEFLGRGIAYCATCDAAFFKEKDIVVVGGGDTAVEEALFLTRFGKKVTLIHRRDRLRAVKILQERAESNDKLNFVWDSVVEEIKGKEKVEKVIVRNIKNDKTQEIPCDGVFIFIGWKPNTDFLKGVIDMSDKGSIIVDNDMKTSIQGIFAAGDCCHKLLHQVITAAGDGATAAFSAQHYVEALKGTEYK